MHDKFGFWVLIGSSCNKIDWLTRYSKKQAKTKRFVCKHRAVSLSLALSLSLYFYDLLSKFANSLDPEDRPRTCLIRDKHAYQEFYNIVRLWVRWSPHAERNISDKYLLSDACHGRIQRGDRGSGHPENHKNIGFPSNIDPDPLKITKLPSQHSMVGHYRQWRFADGPMVVHF